MIVVTTLAGEQLKFEGTANWTSSGLQIETTEVNHFVPAGVVKFITIAKEKPNGIEEVVEEARSSIEEEAGA